MRKEAQGDLGTKSSEIAGYGRPAPNRTMVVHLSLNSPRCSSPPPTTLQRFTRSARRTLTHPTCMIKRMASKLHLGQPKHPDSSASSAASSYTSSAPSVSILSHEHRASISTQRTSLHEWVKDQAEALQQERPPQSDAVPLEVRRSKGSYRLTDFIIQRTLGTGSFGRVHLGESLQPYSTLPTPCEEIFCLNTSYSEGTPPSRHSKWALRTV